MDHEKDQQKQKVKTLFGKLSLTENQPMIQYVLNQKDIEIQKILKRFFQIFNQKHEWTLQSRWQRLKLKQIFEKAKIIRAQKIDLCNNKQVHLIKLIKLPIYENLKILILRNNKIQSIQQLSQISMINLENLILSDNNITSLRSLRKCTFPKLKDLSFYANRLRQVQWITEMNLPKTQNKLLIVFGINCILNIEWLNKMSNVISEQKDFIIGIQCNRTIRGKKEFKRKLYTNKNIYG